MVRGRVVVLSALALVLVVVLAACASTPTTGSLKVTVKGLPGGLNALVAVTMGSYSQTVTATTTLSGLMPGTYSVAPQSVTLRRNVFDGTASSATVTVSAGAAANATVTYAAQPGNLWVADQLGNAIYEFAAATLGTTSTPTLTITDSNGPTAVAFDASGNLWVVELGGGVVEYTAASIAAGTPAQGTSLSNGLNGPNDLAFDASGNLWVANYSGYTVVEFTASSLSNSSATPAITISDPDPTGLTFDASGNLWVANLNDYQVVEFTASSLSNPSATPAITIADSSWPFGLRFAASGDLWVGNFNDATAFRFDGGSLSSSSTPAATITTAVGSPDAIAPDVLGNLWVGSFNSPTIVQEYAAADINGTGSSTPTAQATLTGFTAVTGVAFDPPPYNQPLSH